MSRRLLAAAGMIVFAAATASAQVSITTCGQTVPAGETGVVEVDITCGTDIGMFVVRVENGGTLDLAGHTLAGGNAAVRCEDRRCTVTSTVGVGTIRDTGTAGISVPYDRGRLEVSNITLDNNGIGVLANFSRGRVSGEQVTLTGSGIGIQARKIQLTGLTATGNYRVTQSPKTILEDSTVTASDDTAISGRAAVLKNSTVTGSGSGIDLLTERRPRLVGSTCGVSRNLSNPTQTWGVCTND